MSALPDGFVLEGAPPPPSLPSGFMLEQPAETSTLADVAKSFPAGVARGAIGLAGMPGDVRDIVLSALPKPPAPQPAPSGLYGKVVSALEGARSALELPTSAGIQNKVESLTGPLYQPQTTAGRYAQTAGEFLPAAAGGEGSLGSRLLKMVALPSVASEAAGEATQGTAAEPVARMAGAILGGGIPAALGRASAARAAIPSTPTAEALYQAGRNQYKQIKNLGVEIDPVPISHLMDSVENDLTQDGLTARNVPETYGVISALKNPPPGSVLTAQNFDSARQELLQATKNATNRREAAAAWPVINRLDDYLANIPASHVLNGDAQQAAQLFNSARGNWAAAKRADIVGGKLDLAELNAATANSGTNIDNATRQAVKQLLRPDNYGRTLAEKSGFNANEIALMNSVARGTATGNTLRFVGKLLGGGGGIAQALIGGAGAAASYETGDPRYLALPLMGIGAKKLSDLSTARRAAALDQAVRMRSPLAASMQAPSAPQTLTQFQRAVLNAIAARQGAMQPAQQRQALPSF